MAGETSGVYPTANAIVDKTAVGTFIPEIWSDEVIAEYEKNLKMAPLVKRMPMTGKKGDTVHIPKPVRGTASAKAESAVVNIQANLEEELTVVIDRHFEYSRFIEDIAETQALNSLRQFYTSDAGYQLARRVDTDLINVSTGFGDGTRTTTPTTDGTSWVNSNSFIFNGDADLATYAVDTYDGAATANGQLIGTFTDAGFRDAIQKMDDADVPMDGRSLVIPPSGRKSMLGISQYVSADFVSGRPRESGLIGNLYGVDVYVSSNMPTVELASGNTVGTVDLKAALFFHKDAIVMAEQMSVRSQTQYKQEYLSTLYTADMLYGVQAYRPEGGFILVMQ